MHEHLNNNTQQESCQEYLARISAPGYQSPLVAPDDEPLSPKENLQSILNDAIDASPGEPMGVLIVKFIKALPTIAEVFDNQPDYSDLLQELIEAVKESNRLKGGKDARR